MSGVRDRGHGLVTTRAMMDEHVECASCGLVLADSAALETRPPCPACGSTSRRVSVVAHAEPALAYATAFDAAVVIEHAKVTAIDAETGEKTVIFDDTVSPTAIADGLARHARKVDNTYRVQFEWTELN